MNLNHVMLAATNVARSAEFYRRLGFVQSVSSSPSYARFECADGATFSLHEVATCSACTTQARTGVSRRGACPVKVRNADTGAYAIVFGLSTAAPNLSCTPAS